MRPLRSSLAVVAVAVAGLIGPPAVTRAQSPPPGTDRVEEDWRLVIAEPDPAGAGPQVTTCMSPDDGRPDCFVAFNLNYRPSPSFAAGGVQVESRGGGAVADSASQGSAQCDTPDERITWTQRMSLEDGAMTYSVEDGESTTWGEFGRGHGLRRLTVDTPASSFDSYSPAASAGNSAVGWQKNRVSELTLLRVRYYRAGNLIATDTRSRPVVGGDPGE